MLDPMNRRTLLGAAIGAAGLRVPSNASATRSFVIRDWLGRDWRNERVRFPLGSPSVGPGYAVRDAGGGLVPFEIVGDSIELLVDVPAFAERRFELRADDARAQTDLRVRETPDLIILSNQAGAIALRRRLTHDQAPIAGIDRGDGTWVGSSRLAESSDAVTSYQASIERRGPVAATVVCRASFASGIAWELRVTLQASDPAVLVEEVWSQWDHPELVLDFSTQFAPTHLYYRNGADEGAAAVGVVAFEPLSQPPGRKVFELEPWLHWWFSARRGNWLAAYSEQAPKALVVAALRGDLWLTDQDLASARWPQVVDVVRAPGGLEFVFPGKASRRSWLLAMLPNAAIDQGLVGKHVRPPPQDLVIRHGDFPLDRVKDLVLSWPHADSYPSRLMLEPDDIERLKSSPPDEKALAAARGTPLGKSATNEAALGRIAPAYLATGDESLGRKLSVGAVAQMQAATELFTGQDRLVTLGFAPHWHTAIIYAAHVADFGLADPFLSAEERDRLRAQAAFLAYTVSRPDYWSMKHGFSANPSMTTTVAAYQAYLACLIPDHPLAKSWLDVALGELMNQLLTWSDADGGWLEAPHYAMNAYDYLLGVAVCARNKGRPEMIEHPRLRRVLEWFGKISTPPDIRLDNERHFPPIGNTLLLERTGEFGLAAYLWRKTDPQLSAKLQWLHEASGSPNLPFIGGAYPAFAPYRAVFSDASLPSAEPDYASELFPKTGAILRTGFGTARESQLLMIAGPNHSHYDYDSGSITIWGKGRRISDDFGYTGRAPMSDHSMVDSPGNKDIFDISTFRRMERADYIEGSSGGWRRQVLFVKDEDPLGANYYVIRDVLDPGQAGVWRLWFAGEVQLNGDHAVVVGADDVDTDVVLFGADPLQARAETISRNCPGGATEAAAMTTTQTAVAVPLASGGGLVAIVIPRLKGARPARCRLGQAPGVFEVSSERRADTICISDDVRELSQSGVTFRGRVGAFLGHGPGSLVVIDDGQASRPFSP